MLPGESVTVKAIFSPDYSRIWPFLAAFKIEVQDQVKTLISGTT